MRPSLTRIIILARAKSALKEAECRAAVSNRFGFKGRCLTAGGVHVAEFSGSLGGAKRSQGCPVEARRGGTN